MNFKAINNAINFTGSYVADLVILYFSLYYKEKKRMTKVHQGRIKFALDVTL